MKPCIDCWGKTHVDHIVVTDTLVAAFIADRTWLLSGSDTDKFHKKDIVALWSSTARPDPLTNDDNTLDLASRWIDDALDCKFYIGVREMQELMVPMGYDPNIVTESTRIYLFHEIGKLREDSLNVLSLKI